MLRTRRWLVRAGVGAAVVLAAVGVVAVGYHHLYRISVSDSRGLPDRVQACGRSFRFSDSPAVVDRRTADADRPGDEPFQQVGEYTAPLHVAMEILGHPRSGACGVVILVGPDDRHLSAYALQGGP